MLDKKNNTHKLKIMDEQLKSALFLDWLSSKTEEQKSECLRLYFIIHEYPNITTGRSRTAEVTDVPKPKNNIYHFPLIILNGQIIGVQAKILKYLHSISDKNGITEKVYTDETARQCGLPILSIKKSLMRLKKKGLLEYYEIKKGSRGWRRYKLAEVVMKDPVLRNNLIKL